MALVAGSVSVAGGVATGNGFAYLVYLELESAINFIGVPTAGQQAAKSQLAVIANAAARLITHVTTNAQVSTTDTGGAPITWTGTGSGTVA